MSLINDIRLELSRLEVSQKKLRQFGLLIGGIFFLLSLWFFFRNSAVLSALLFALAFLLLTSSIIRPISLRLPYRCWMTIAFVLGGMIARLLLTIIFYLILTPIGFTARFFGKKMLDIKFHDKKNSYWIPVDSNKQYNYEKMF